MSDIKLSFCIPTYNRANYIGQTLTSIADQIVEGDWTDCIEICVSDNASTDNTVEVIRHFQVNYPSVKLIYSKNNENLGADRNYLRVVELASGEYCWLFGSDDALVTGAISRILHELQFNYDIILSNRIECDINLNRLLDRYWLDPKIGSCIYNFNDTNEIQRYFQDAHSLGALFSYLSSIVVKRASWNSIKFEESFIGTAYAHVYILLLVLLRGSILKYHLEPTVLSRGGNDSFATKGFIERMKLDLDGYRKLANLFEYAKSRRYFLRVMHREHSWTRWFRVRQLSTGKEWSLILNLLYFF